ncbi:hypothetical protein FCU45_00460 [Sulfurimonas crateris]|uniref:Uncharacterized protein n=1 Tax=Sulfurimonas crateris TaxID=2574727 RepID=A0A4U2Z9A5_9BACT|nr:hypothetical protein [Sulfurimonas crateris]TKI70897.1 hypothetical protein FCU45_00460 [Sulfurimonas crateris]
MVSFLMDENGKKTHAVIPIEEWEKIELYIQQDEQSEISLYPSFHIKNVLSFIKEHNDLSLSEWQTVYENFYSYYKKLDIKDVMALQLFRAGILGRAYIENNIVVYEELFKPRPIKFLIEKDGSPIKEKSLKILREAVANCSEYNFLDIFNKTVSFDPDLISDYRSEYKRLRRDAERDRMFIYDLDVLYSIQMFNSDKEFQQIFTNDENISIGEFRGLINKYIAEHLYNGNVSQVYRAAKEGAERVQNILI